MSNANTALALYMAVAENATHVPASMQREIVRVAHAAKSAAGDALLASLAVRDDASDETRAVVEASPRAVVKAAWMTRRDHPAGYVEATLASEKRITILTAVAQHPDTSLAALDQLGRHPNSTVALAVLGRSDVLGSSTRTAALSTVANNWHGLSYMAKYELRTLLEQHPNAWADALMQVTEPRAAMAIAIDPGNVLADEALPHIATVALSRWREYADVPEGVHWYKATAYELFQACNKLSERETWVEDSDEDKLLAEAAQAVGTNPSASLSDAAKDAVSRHFGTDRDRERMAKRKRDRERHLHKVRTTTDASLLREYADKPTGSDEYRAVVENPHLRLEHLPDQRSTELVDLLVARGGNPIHGAAILATSLDGGLAARAVAGIADDDLVEAAKHAVETLRVNSGGYGFPAKVSRLLVHPRLGPHVAIELSVAEILAVLDLPHRVDSSILTNALASLLGNTLETDKHWETFSALAGDLNGPIADTAKISTSV